MGHRPLAICPSHGSLEDALIEAGADPIVVQKFPNPLDPAIRRKPLFTGRNAGKLVYRLTYMRNLAKTFQMNPIRLVHINTLIGTSAALAATMTGLPIVWHIHEHETHFRRAGSIRVRLVRLLADHVIAISNQVRDQLLAYGLRPTRVTVVHDGIDVDAYRRRVTLGRTCTLKDQLAIPRDRLVVGMAGQLTPLKGVDIFVSMAAIVKEELGSNVHFLVVGGTPQSDYADYATFLNETVYAAGLGNNLTFTGHRPDIADYMALMDVVVTPSRQEPFGLVSLEAMALEKPVVATGEGGSAEIIQDGLTGFLVPPEEPRALAERVISLLNQTQLRRTFGQRGLARVRSEFTLERYIQEVLSVHRLAIERSRNSLRTRLKRNGSRPTH
jgi:glycosyltransferase involved in cell wall biosynthesis